MKVDNYHQLQLSPTMSDLLGNCYISNVVSVARYLGSDITDDEVCACIGHTYHYGSWIQEEKEERYPTLMSFDADVNQAELIGTLKNFGIYLTQTIVSSEAEVIDLISESIKKSIPVIVNVDSYFLKYWPDNIQGHYAHYIVIYGLSEDLKSISIIDNYIPSTPSMNYQGDIETIDFIHALNFKDIRINHTKKIVWHLELTKKNRIKHQEVFASYKKNTMNHFMKKEGKKEVEIGCFKYIFYSNFEALYDLHQALFNVENSDLNDENMIELYKNITSFGGPVRTLSLIKYFLKKYEAGAQSQEKISCIIINIDNLLKLWKKFGIRLFRYTVNHDSNNIVKAAKSLEDIMAVEEDNLRILKEMDEIPSLKKAFLYPTMRCNLSCRTCYSGGNQDDSKAENEMSLQEYQDIIRQLYKLGVKIFDISGGEPLLRDDLVSILKEIKKYSGTVVYLVSNGTLINQYQETVQEVIHNIDRFYLSIDSTVEDEHNKIRGNTKAFTNTMKGLSKLQAIGFQDIGINFLIMHDNKEQIIPILDFAFAKNIKYINLLRFLDVVKGENVQDQNLNLQMYIDIYHIIENWVNCHNLKKESFQLSEIKLVLPGYCFKPFMVFRKRSSYFDKIKFILEFDPIQGCMAFSENIIIKSDGYITGCTAMANHTDLYIGNIHSQGDLFFERWKMMKYKLSLREKNLKTEEPCKSCEYWKICKGGCPAVASKYHGDFTKIDPTCIKFV